MSVAIRAITRLQDADDVNVTPAVGVDEYALVYDHDTAKFLLRAPAAAPDLSGYALLAGRAGGQTLYGGTAANDDITIHGTSDATRTTSYVLLQPTAGNVGIGITAPATILHAVSTTATTNALRNVLTLGANVTSTGVGAAGLGGAILFQAETSTTADSDVAQIGALWTTATHATRASALTFSTLTAGGSLTERMRIDGAGYVGIGTTAPTTMLDIVRNSGNAIFYPGLTVRNINPSNPGGSGYNFAVMNMEAGNGVVSAQFGANYGTGEYVPWAESGFMITTRTAHPIIFYTGATTTEKMRITSAGLVGIGDAAPAEALDVTGNINTTGVVKVDDVQVLSNRVIDARAADVANSGDATTDGLIDALRDAMVAHGLIAAA